MMHSAKSYANYSNFGSCVNQPEGDNHPLTMCLVESMDAKFQNGGSPVFAYGPRTKNCQMYMAERCAKNWDGFCEYAYQTQQPSNGDWFARRTWPNAGQMSNINNDTTMMSLGDILLQNAAARKYCVYPDCHLNCEPFNPMDPKSPKITWYESNQPGGTAIPVCNQNIDPNSIDMDPVMNRMLANPKPVATTLINICNTAQRNGTNLTGTKLGAFCNSYFRLTQ